MNKESFSKEQFENPKRYFRASMEIEDKFTGKITIRKDFIAENEKGAEEKLRIWAVAGNNLPFYRDQILKNKVEVKEIYETDYHS
jgi:hypothetical protein